MAGTRKPTTPQERSELARKAAKARWAAGTGKAEAGSSAVGVDARAVRRFNRHEWIRVRRCLRLEQEADGLWMLVTPTGLRMQASPGEVSLWLDLVEVGGG